MNPKNSVTDFYNRPLHDLRISVIDQCNFRCTYCMPEEVYTQRTFLTKEQLLSFDEIETIVKSFVSLGVKKLRITGGEPLLRKSLPELIQNLSLISGIEDIALTTNGLLLPKFARSLKESGVKRVNVSLDALDDDIFGRMNGRNVQVQDVMKGIFAAKEAGLEIKINMVVQKGVNDQQIMPMVQFFKDKEMNLRFIEYMDVGTSNGWNMNQVVTKKEIYQLIQDRFPLMPVSRRYYGEVAKRYKHIDSNAEIGFISSVSEAFCSTCTRARLSADGKIYTCLFSNHGFDLKNLVREGTSQELLKHIIKDVWNTRIDRYSEERTNQTDRKERIEMYYIGG